MTFTCWKCKREFNWNKLLFGENVTCEHCGAENTTDWDYVGEGDSYGIQQWTTGIVEPEKVQS